MISIIICSRALNISNALTENIKNTIGCVYELFVIDNSQNNYSIFEAYNLGIEKSKGEYICFIHDDILLHTNGWGKIIHHIFNEDAQIGLIGVAGAKVKTKMPSAWWDCAEDQKAVNIIQHYPNKEKEKCEFGFNNSPMVEVVAIDGVFMALRKDTQLNFNTNITGFHNYDLNISFECQKNNYKIVVTKDILVEHFSLGNLNASWIESTYAIHILYKSLLPICAQKYKCNKKAEVSNAMLFIKECLQYKKYKIAYSVWVYLFFIKPVSKYHIQFWKRMLKNKLC